MKKPNEESARNVNDRKYIYILLGCAAAAVLVGALLWQPKFADTETLSGYDYGMEDNTVATTDPVDYIPSMSDEEYDDSDYEQDIEVQDEEIEDSEQSDDSVETAAEDETVPKQIFALPMENAEITRDFCVTELAYDETMEDWRTHAATDFGGKAGDTVNAIADGTVIKVGEDILYGKYVLLNHAGDIQSKYAGIEDIAVSEGDSVTCGQKIAVLGESMPSEAKQGTHLHLEVKKEGKNVNINEITDISG